MSDATPDPGRLEERFADWVDDRLDPQERQQLEADMAADPELAAEAAQYRATVEALRKHLEFPEPPAELVTGVMERVQRQRTPRLRWMPLAASLTAAAALVFMVVWLNQPPGTARPEEVAKGQFDRVEAPYEDARDDAPRKANEPKAGVGLAEQSSKDLTKLRNQEALKKEGLSRQDQNRSKTKAAEEHREQQGAEKEISADKAAVGKAARRPSQDADRQKRSKKAKGAVPVEKADAVPVAGEDDKKKEDRKAADRKLVNKKPADNKNVVAEAKKKTQRAQPQKDQTGGQRDAEKADDESRARRAWDNRMRSRQRMRQPGKTGGKAAGRADGKSEGKPEAADPKARGFGARGGGRGGRGGGPGRGGRGRRARRALPDQPGAERSNKPEGKAGRLSAEALALAKIAREILDQPVPVTDPNARPPAAPTTPQAKPTKPTKPSKQPEPRKPADDLQVGAGRVQRNMRSTDRGNAGERQLPVVVLHLAALAAEEKNSQNEKDFNKKAPNRRQANRGRAATNERTAGGTRLQASVRSFLQQQQAAVGNDLRAPIVIELPPATEKSKPAVEAPRLKQAPSTTIAQIKPDPTAFVPKSDDQVFMVVGDPQQIAQLFRQLRGLLGTQKPGVAIQQTEPAVQRALDRQIGGEKTTRPQTRTEFKARRPANAVEFFLVLRRQSR